jgi:N utilization substance protein B
VLRLAAFEMMFLDTPHGPVIEVAVRIAKKFGGEESGKFVNGVLARLKKRLESERS